MKILHKALLLITLISTNLCFAEMIQAPNLEDVAEVLKQADQETLVVLDIDDVLIAPTNEFAIREPIRLKLNKELRAKYTKDQIKIMFSDFFQKRTVSLVNPKITDLIEQLAQRNVPVTALTGWWTGQFGNIPHMEDLRFKGLDEVGISFVKTSPFKEDWTFPDLRVDKGVVPRTNFPPLRTDKGGIPMIKNGIILASLADKGQVLQAALDKAGLKYNKIIFIDDNLFYLQAVEKSCRDLNIQFIGVNYTEASLAPIPQLDEVKEQMRFEVLRTEHIWLSDKELEKRLVK